MSDGHTTSPISPVPARGAVETALPPHHDVQHPVLWNATPRRAGIEAALVVALGLGALVVASLRAGGVALLGSVIVGELVALLLAVRLQVPSADQRLAAEARVAVLLAFGMGGMYAAIGVVALATGAIGLGVAGLSQLLLLALDGIGLMLLHGVSYLLFRGLFGVLRWWNRLRQRRLLWALTHDQLVIVLVLMVVFGIGAALVAFVMGVFDGLASGPLSLDILLTQMFGLSLVGAFYLALVVLMLVGTLPLAILLSHLLVRRIVRRVEQLANATDALRRGDYAARVAVVGQDEIAQLQVDFNVMAADLDHTLQSLQSERDRVSGLLHAQRELTASISHELRTPVATQRSYLDTVLKDDRDLAPDVRAELAVVERETQRLQRLIDDLFMLSRAEVGRLTLRLEPLDLGLLAERVAATLAPIAWQQSRITVTAQAPHTGALALADEARCEQILRNLVHNGIRHTPPGGIVAIVVTEADDHILVQVNDTGSGIAPQDLPHIWDRFYRADAARTVDRHGAGLGLALVKELTEAMNGSVAVESTIGMGSSFSVRLPRATA